MPLLFTVATEAVPLLHVPPEAASDKLVVAPTHTVGVPVIGPGNELIVIVCVLDVNGDAQ